MVLATRARGDGGRRLCGGTEPRVDGGCSMPGPDPGATWRLEAGDLQQLPLAWVVSPGAGLRCMDSLAGAWSCVSCIFLGFSVPCRNFRAHQR